MVPSRAKDGERYTVIPGLRCSCPDHETRQVKCKHLWAVEYVMERETDENGMVTETEAVLPSELDGLQCSAIRGKDSVRRPVG